MDTEARNPGPSDDEVRDGFKFRSGRLALDFGATLARRASMEPRELLAEPSDLARWLRAAGLAATMRGIGERDVRYARELREALYRLAAATTAGTKTHDARQSKADRELVNRWAAKSAPAPQFVLEADWRGRMAWVQGSVLGCLAAIARDGVTLLAGPLAARVRKCDGCTILFVDLSRSGTRRWCSMSACGNKAKVAAFRRRQGGE